MGIEKNKEYIYYTVISLEDYIDELPNSHFTWEALMDLVEKKFINSTDPAIRDFRVDSGFYCSDVNDWVNENNLDDVCTVFTKFDDQQNYNNNCGQLFQLYETEDDDEEDLIEPPQYIQYRDESDIDD